MQKENSRTEMWHEGVELLTIWFKKPLKQSSYGFTPQVEGYAGLIGKKQTRSYNEDKKRVELKPCLIETSESYIHLSFPLEGSEKEFLALFSSNDTVVSRHIFSSSIGVSIPKKAISRMQRSGKRMFRRKNPTCNWCDKESDRRAAIKLPEDTPAEEAYIVEDGKPYGYFYWGCNGCLKRLEKDLGLHIFND